MAVLFPAYSLLPPRSTAQHAGSLGRPHLSFHQALCPPGAACWGRCPGCSGNGQEVVLTESHCRHANQSGTGTGLCSGHSGRCPSGCKGHTADTQGFLRNETPSDSTTIAVPAPTLPPLPGAPQDFPSQTHRLCHWQSPLGSVAAAGSLRRLNFS